MNATVKLKIEDFEPVSRVQERRFKRFAVIGDPSSGKTTFAKSLSKILGYPLKDIDVLRELARLQAGNKVSIILLRNLVATNLKSETWISAGNYEYIRDIYWYEADVIIWLDYSLLYILSRSIRRTFYRMILNRERKWYYKDKPRSIHALIRELKILRWILTKHYTERKQFELFFKERKFSQIKIVRLSHPKIARELLDKIASANQ